MRSCASLFSGIAITLAGCTAETGQHGFRVTDVRLTPGHRRLDVHFDQELRLSPEAVEALRHGVALTLNLDMELRDSSTLTRVANQRRTYVIRHLPLSQHYQLTDRLAGRSRTFPRMRHAINELSSLDLAFETGPLAPGSYEFRARMRLDQTSLPAPMQLPAVLSDEWRHDSEWTTWPFTLKTDPGMPLTASPPARPAEIVAGGRA